MEGSTLEAVACQGRGLGVGARRATTCFLGLRPLRKALAGLPSLSREWVPRFFRARIKTNRLLAPSMYFYALKQALSEEFYLHQLTNSLNNPMRQVLAYPTTPRPISLTSKEIASSRAMMETRDTEFRKVGAYLHCHIRSVFCCWLCTPHSGLSEVLTMRFRNKCTKK